MSAIFLSASVPKIGRRGYDTANPYLIREAVSAFVEVVLGRRPIVWGGHPAITPMIWAAAEALGLNYERCVQLFQSRYFEDKYPEDNLRYRNVRYVDAIKDDEKASLTYLRNEMISSQPFEAAVFIGGMEGLFEEYHIFKRCWPKAYVLAIPSPGGVSAEIFEEVGGPQAMRNAIDYSAWLYDLLNIRTTERRSQFFERKT